MKEAPKQDHHDRCRPEVAVARHNCSTQLVSLAHSVRIPPSAVSGSPAPHRVARSLVTFLVTTLRWPPVRCAAGLVFLRSAVPRESRLPVPAGGLAYGTRGELKWTSVTPEDKTPSEGCPLLAVSRSSWGPAGVSSHSVWSSAIALGTEDGGSLSHLSPPVPGPRGGRGHTCRTPPRACSVSNATPPSGHAVDIHCATEVAVRAVLVGSCTMGAAVQRRPRG